MKGEVEENETCLEFLIFHFGTACHLRIPSMPKLKMLNKWREQGAEN
jgi:hypothetical protein